MIAKVRLDTLLHQRGLFDSRSRAAASVMAGEVRVGDHGERAAKPGLMVADDVALAVDDKPRYVSRGGTKLQNAITTRGIDVRDRHALDVGASTGGFTDCLLQGGAIHVIALDVAYGELSWTLRNDPRVTVMERYNARALRPEELAYRPDLIVADVSFISLTKLMAAVLGVAADSYDALLMVKPQFEVGKGRVGSGGVVRDPALRREAMVTVAHCAMGLGAAVLGFASSGLPGPKGNQETFVHLAEGTRAGALDAAGIAAAAEEIES
ncbi:MAG TPA: TlyA family RNA methyltransferase [Baekduia sp.]|nr:TlyA family RNA methyltransferase [Baekduia sp.]